jgi:hypothetical protein
MKESVMNIRVIEPSDGCYLTKKNRKENEDLVLSTKVVLSAKDSADNWVEIPIEEGEALRIEVLKSQGIDVENLQEM